MIPQKSVTIKNKINTHWCEHDSMNGMSALLSRKQQKIK